MSEVSKPVLARCWGASASDIRQALALLPERLGLVLGPRNYYELVPWCAKSGRPYALDLHKNDPHKAAAMLKRAAAEEARPVYCIHGPNEPNYHWTPSGPGTKAVIPPEELLARSALTRKEHRAMMPYVPMVMGQTRTVGDEFWSHIWHTRRLDLEYQRRFRQYADPEGLLRASGSGRTRRGLGDAYLGQLHVIEYIPENDWYAHRMERMRGNTLANWLSWLNNPKHDALALTLDGSVTTIPRRSDGRESRRWGLTHDGRLTLTGREVVRVL